MTTKTKALPNTCSTMGVIVRHSWNGNIYFGHRDYDHNIEVVDDAGYEFEKKSLSYNMQKSHKL